VLIRRLEVSGVRNLTAVKLDPLSRVNIVFGVNGAGKTSLLESLHVLSSARSFRSHKINTLIKAGAEKCTCFAEIDIPGVGYQPCGVERFRGSNKPSSIKISGQAVTSASALAENLPLQVISSDTFKLIEGAPAIRRQFMDWGVFHVEHGFHAVWKTAQRCLKQRNSLLRHGRIDAALLDAWTKDFVVAGEQLDGYRARYFDQFMPVFNQLLGKLIQLEGLELRYYRGWDKELSLAEVLFDSKVREREQGHTLVGPHRADLKLRYQGSAAADILSRGQQKLVVCAMRVAQGYLLSQLTGKSCVFLVDDLPAELDKQHRQALCELLEDLKCQVFVTCVDYKDVIDYWSRDIAKQLFHVEHGCISVFEPPAPP
jgi:DNA replication and repair protein RecF